MKEVLQRDLRTGKPDNKCCERHEGSQICIQDASKRCCHLMVYRKGSQGISCDHPKSASFLLQKSSVLDLKIRACLWSAFVKCTQLLYSLLQHRKLYEIHRHSTSIGQEPLLFLSNLSLERWKRDWRVGKDFLKAFTHCRCPKNLEKCKTPHITS